jgi:hypothetical protein
VQGPLQKEGLVIHVIAERLIDRSDLLRRLADIHDLEAPVARADRLKPDRGRSTPRRRAPAFELPLAHADHVKRSGPPDPRDPDARRREQTLLEPLRRHNATPGRDRGAAASPVRGFKSRDFH